MSKGLLKELCGLNGLNVYVKRGRLNGCFDVVLDFFVDGKGLFFIVFEKGLWAVDCEGKCLIFDGLELVKIG